MKLKSLVLYFIILSSVTLFAQPIKVTPNHRYLETPDGQPFFWLGDTAWELFHRLDREEAQLYLKNRSGKGFNVIQAVVLYELEAFETPNVYGDFPLISEDITRPDTTKGNSPNDALAYDYWDHVEWVVQEAAKLDMIVGMLPCWGEYVTARFREPNIVNPEQGYHYGWFIGNRYRHLNDHIIWILGGDRLPDERVNGVNIWRAMAEGITDAVNGENDFDHTANYETTFMTYHCYRSSSVWFHEDAFLDMHTWGSYHEQRDNERAYFEAYEDWNLPNPKPTLNSEPAYELLPINYDWKNASHGYFDDFDARQVAYWSAFSGTAGHTYGCHPVWQMYKKENPHPPLTDTVRKEWHEALDEDGAFQMQYLKNLIISRPFLSRVPNEKLFAENPYDPTGRLVACSGDGYAMIYIPTGKEVLIDSEQLPSDQVNCWWYNPRTGKSEFAGKMAAQGIMSFDPPGETARGNDWVLVMDDPGKNFEKSGTYFK